MPQTRSTSTRLVALLVAAAITVAGFVTGASLGPAGAAAPTVAPTIVSPDLTDHDENPVFEWQAIPGVTKYKFQVSANDSFSGTLLHSADVLNTSATPPKDLPLGTIYWRVAGMDGSTVGPFAQASFTRVRLPGPQLIGPADGSTLEFPGDPVVLRWAPVQGVKDYEVEIDDAPDFIGAQSIVTESTNWALLDPQVTDQTFYWRVQGRGVPASSGAQGVGTEFSQTWSYDIDWAEDGSPSVPVLTEPADGADVTDVVFRWNPVPGAASYQIQVSPNGDWASTTIDLVVKGTSYSPPQTLNNASYFWRVRARTWGTTNSTNPPKNGPWSADGRQFNRSWADVPTLRSPADGEVSAQDFLLRWDPVPFASAYEINVGTDPNFSPNTFQTCTTTHTDWAPYWLASGDPNLPPRPGTCNLGDSKTHRGVYLRQGIRYYWRVRGLDQTTGNSVNPLVLGRFSDVFDFLYLPGATGTPQPTAPTPGTVVEVPTLEWDPVPGVEGYKVVVRVAGEVQQTAVTHATSYTPTLTLPNGVSTASVGWTVQAFQSGFEDSAVSGTGPTVQAGSFTLTDGETGGGSTPVALSPVADTHAVSPSFDWAPVTGAKRYELLLFNAGTNVFTNLVDHNEGGSSSRRHPWRSAFTPTRPIVPGEYEWQVVAYDATDGGSVLGSSARVPITIDPLPVATPTAPANCGQGAACAVERSTPLLRWNPVPGAAHYRVRIALDPEFTNVKWIYTTTQASLRPTEALPDNQAGQSYYWFVQPCRSDSVCGRFDAGVFGTARAFRKASRPISLTSPADGARVGDLVTFRWSAPSDQWVGSDANDDVEARHYRIQISTKSDFSSNLETVDVDQRTYTPWNVTYPEGPIYWRVQARDASGNFLTFSPTRLVTKASPRPVVTSPTNGASVGGLPVIRWDPQPFAAEYQVEYYANGDVTWTSTPVQITRTRLTADTLLKRLAPGTYAYRVRRLDVDGKPGPWSSDPPPGSSNPADGDRRTFTVTGGAPSLVSPANGATFARQRIRLEWEPVAGAATYWVETSKSSSFGQNDREEGVETVMTAWSTAKQYPNGTFYWRVQARDAQGKLLGTSDTYTFVHDLRRPTASITTATAGAGSARITWTVQPNAAIGPATSFVITPYIGSTKQATRTVTGTARELVVTGLTNGTAYRFTVTPYDADGVGIESSQSSAVTPQAVLPFTTIDRFVIRQVTDLWGRAPSTTELAQYRSQIQGGTSAANVVNAIWNHQNHANVTPQITRLYVAYFRRLPDYAGLDHWTKERRRGVSLAAISQTFTKTPEFKTMYGSLDNGAFVDLVYTNVLGRTPSPGDRQYWKSELDSGRRTRGGVMIGFSESPENKTKLQHDVNSVLVYMEMLRRTPTKTEIDTLKAKLQGGQSMPTTFAEILASPEYKPRAT